MINTILTVGCIVMSVVLFACRSLIVQIVRITTRVIVVLQGQTSILSPSEARLLPKKIRYGYRLPTFRTTNWQSGELIDFSNVVDKSSIIMFCTRQEYMQWKLEALLVFLHKCWYRIEGRIYIVLCDDEVSRNHWIPHSEIFDMEIGRYLVIGISRRDTIERAMGLTRTPVVVQLDATMLVQKIGFFDYKEVSK